MDYEKKYKEALERAKGMWEQGMMPERIEYIFPELKESEDERIRKELYKYFRDLQLSSDREFSQSASIDEILDWLEKQGENINPPEFTFDDVLALQCAMYAAKKVQKDKDLYEQLENLHNRLHNAYWLKKQS